MNESDFENELRQIRPAAPSQELERAIASELHTARASRPRAAAISRNQEVPRSRFLFGLTWACGGAAVAVIVTLCFPALQARDDRTVLVTGKTVAPPDPVFEPAATSRELLTAEESDLIYIADQEPARVIRYSSLERHVWSNPSTGARVEVEVPREDAVLVPVSFQ